MKLQKRVLFEDEIAQKRESVNDKKLLWRANLFVDETINETNVQTGVIDWNNINRWNDQTNNEWQTYINYTDPLNPGNQINSLGQQVPILPWTHPYTQFNANGGVHQTYTGTVYSSVAYSWDSGDNFPLFNEKMSIQDQASQDHPNANAEEPSLAPNDN